MLSADERGGAPGWEQRARHWERGEEQLLEQMREGGLRRDKPLEVERRPHAEQCGENRAERGEPDAAEGGAEDRERAGSVPKPRMAVSQTAATHTSRQPSTLKM